MAAGLSKWRTPHFDQTESLSNSYFYNSSTAEPVRRSRKVWRHLRWPHTKRHNILLLTLTVLLARNSFRCLDNLDNKDSHTCIIFKKAWRHTILTITTENVHIFVMQNSVGLTTRFQCSSRDLYFLSYTCRSLMTQYRIYYTLGKHLLN
jgi:hypothetical protein